MEMRRRGGEGRGGAGEPTWRKVLYENQNRPDNYVDPSFLDEMKKNLYLREYKFWPVVRESGVVTQQLSSLVLFVVIFIFMAAGKLQPHALVAASSLLTLAGYVLHYALQARDSAPTCSWGDVRSALVFLSFGFGLSPILMTLTDTVSTDTIYAMTTAALLANLMFHDYGANAAMVSQAVSLNAAIFASVCLASRLPTAWHAFATIKLAMELFGLWPVLRRNIKKSLPGSLVWLTAVLGVGAAVVLATVSTVAAIMFVLVHLFISFLCPAWLIGLQPYKNNIYGPWDEAVIKD